MPSETSKQCGKMRGRQKKGNQLNTLRFVTYANLLLVVVVIRDFHEKGDEQIIFLLGTSGIKM